MRDEDDCVQRCQQSRPRVGRFERCRPALAVAAAHYLYGKHSQSWATHTLHSIESLYVHGIEADLSIQGVFLPWGVQTPPSEAFISSLRHLIN